MLRAAPLTAVDGFLRYYHAIGFELVTLFFDAPDEDVEAIAIAREHAREVGGVRIHLCDKDWWDERLHRRLAAAAPLGVMLSSMYSTVTL